MFRVCVRVLVRVRAWFRIGYNIVREPFRGKIFLILQSLIKSDSLLGKRFSQ